MLGRCGKAVAVVAISFVLPMLVMTTASCGKSTSTVGPGDRPDTAGTCCKSVEGTVRIKNTVTALAGAVVSTTLDAQTATTDATGHFLLTTATRITSQSGTAVYTLTVAKAGYQTFSVPTSGDRLTGLAIELAVTPDTGIAGPAFVALAAGTNHTCGLTTAKELYCWGRNVDGQLGDGTSTNRQWPTLVGGGFSFVSVTAGHKHTCALTIAGVAYCWGDAVPGGVYVNSQPPITVRRTPTMVAAPVAFTSLVAGMISTCGLSTTGVEYCWGSMGGPYGDGNPNGGDRLIPIPVTGTWTSITLGRSACALTAEGAAYCWGWYVGDGVPWENSLGAPERYVPTAVIGGLSFASLSAGGDMHSCGLTRVGVAYCWGSNVYGQLGDGTTGLRLSPTAVAGGLTFASLAQGGGGQRSFTCALTAAGASYCWGRGDSGNLGRGDNQSTLTPSLVSGGLTFTSVVAGGMHTCWLANTGRAYCAGSNEYSQLGVGDSTSTPRLVPTQVRFKGP